MSTINAFAFLKAHADTNKGTVAVSVRFDADNIVLLGSNFPCSVPVGESCKSFFITPEKGKWGVAVIEIVRRKEKQISPFSEDFFLQVNFDDTPVVELEEAPWIPRADRLVRVVDDDHIEMTTRDQIFTTEECSGTESRFVDPTTLCKYLCEEISFEDLDKAASEHVASASDRERIRQLESIIEEDLERLNVLNKDLRVKTVQLGSLEHLFTDWHSAALALHAAVHRQIYCRPSVLSALNNINDLIAEEKFLSSMG